MKPIRVLITGSLVAILCLTLGMPSATAGHPSDGSRDPLVIAQAMAANPASVISAQLESTANGATDHKAVMQYGAPNGLLGGFPTDGGDFGMISNGETNYANDPNSGGSLSTGLLGLNTNRDEDLAGFTITFAVPAGTGQPCVTMDVKWLSEEFPEYIASTYNDFATARINNTLPPSVSDNDKPVAEGNFLRDPNHAALDIQNNYDVRSENADGTVGAGPTTYDGGTPKLLARSPVFPNNATQFTLSFYVADVGDSIYDSTLFVDNIRVTRESGGCPLGTIGPTRITAQVEAVTGTRGRVNGIVAPAHDGDEVKLTLQKKNRTAAAFRTFARKTAVLTDDPRQSGVSAYSANFQRVDARFCRVRAVYAGDSDHFGSKTKKSFNC